MSYEPSVRSTTHVLIIHILVSNKYSKHVAYIGRVNTHRMDKG